MPAASHVGRPRKRVSVDPGQSKVIVTTWSSASSSLLNGVALEHDNLRAAIEWALAHDPALALGMAQRVGAFWQKRTLWNEGRAWLKRVLDATPATASTDRAIALWRAGRMPVEKLLTSVSPLSDINALFGKR